MLLSQLLVIGRHTTPCLGELVKTLPLLFIRGQGGFLFALRGVL